ncbi:hypothetical protein F4826_004738 [Rahnella inusitata]|nr:hypothetical protein [Rahnella inusitata]
MLIAFKNSFMAFQKRKEMREALSENSFYKVRFRSERDKKIAKFLTLFSLALAALVIGDAAHAFTTPAAGSFGYNIYDIAINKVAKGPIGFVGGGWLIATAATKMNEGWVRALPYAIGGSCLIKVDELTTSLGALIH